MADHYWWRFRFTAAQSGPDVNIATLKARRDAGGADIPLYFLTPYAPAVSATNDLNGATQLFDTDTTTGWGVNVTSPQDIILRFQRPMWIGEFDLQLFSIGGFGFNRLDRSPKDFTLSWSDDGVTYTVENTFAGISWTTLGQTKTFTGTAYTPPPAEAEVGLVAVEYLDGLGNKDRAAVAFVGLEMVDGGGQRDKAAVAHVSLETIVGPPVNKAWVAFLGLEVIIGPSLRAINGPVQII